MEETTSVEGRERRVDYYYDDGASCASYICSCKCFQEALRALLKCLGLDSETSPTDTTTTTTTTPLIMSTSDHDHKDQEDQAAAGCGNVDVIVYDDKPITCQDPVASGSSSSSSGEEQTMADPPSTPDPLPTSSDPSPYTDDDPTSDPAVLALRSRRAPPRPPVTSGRGGQTN